jgi:hypothetical protein
MLEVAAAFLGKSSVVTRAKGEDLQEQTEKSSSGVG